MTTVELRANVTETQAEVLQQRLATLPFKVTYGEEQHGSGLLAVIACAPSQEKAVREILHDLGAALIDTPDDQN